MAGFPCQPYSVLNNNRPLLSDDNAQQLFKVVKRLRRYRPKVSWLCDKVLRCCAYVLCIQLHLSMLFYAQPRLQFSRMFLAFGNFWQNWLTYWDGMLKGIMVAKNCFDCFSQVCFNNLYEIVHSMFIHNLRYNISCNVICPFLGPKIFET